ncbi:unnamed protein product [Staurois parvus]|uniref:Uncharacterized protein n=1 Tax=Staurois parvus TaxID=386267 RepID=A0ABN9BRM5_9NEOB|nr:unnamed protein product [Staurois parvus]
MTAGTGSPGMQRHLARQRHSVIWQEQCAPSSPGTTAGSESIGTNSGHGSVNGSSGSQRASSLTGP